MGFKAGKSKAKTKQQTYLGKFQQNTKVVREMEVRIAEQDDTSKSWLENLKVVSVNLKVTIMSAMSWIVKSTGLQRGRSIRR